MIQGRFPITHVAIRHKGQIWSLPKPFRHYHIFSIMRYLGAETDSCDAHDEDQGFLDENGSYLTRKQAQVSAKLHGQILNNGEMNGSVLTSEDLW